MVNPKASSRKPKSAVGRDRYTAELSTGQLVIGVCILLMFGLGCFLLGVLIGKFDPTLQEDSMIAGTPAESDSSELQPTPPPVTPERSPVPPAENGLRPEDRPPPRIVEQGVPEPSDGPSDAPGPQSTTAQTPANSGTTRTPVAANNETDPPEQVASATPATSNASPPKESEAAKTAAPETKPVPLIPVETKPDPPRVDPPQPAVVSPATPGIVYGVQIIAVARPRAENVKRDIEARSRYKAQIIPIDGDRLCKVVLGRFTDKPAAELVRNEMRDQYAFSDAFVIVLQ